MKKIFICVSFLLAHTLLYAAPTESIHSPLGYWKTIDDVTGEPKSVLKIEQAENGSLSGQVVRIFPQPGHDQNAVCQACQGVRHNKRIIGMAIMAGLKQNTDNPSEWSGGEILDPLSGKTYHCNIQVSDNGQKLRVRGFIGVPLFGRSQTWERVG